MGDTFRRQVSYPLRVGELLLAKLVTLLHDPPWKAWTITGVLRGLHEIMKKPLERYRRGCLCVKISFGDKRHEEQAARLASSLLHVLEECCLVGEHCRTSKRFYRSVSRRADGIASGFDRIVVALAEQAYSSRLRVSVVGELFNPFRPSLVWRCSLKRGKRYDAFKGSISDFMPEMLKRLLRACKCGEPGDCVSGIRRMYHAFSVLYEPLWHKASQGLYRGPADTRAPTHSIFDHLYASSAAVNIEVYGSDEGKLKGVAGFLVYVGWRGIEDWVRASRKLSDMWVASWLATAMVWNAIGGLVWCLGPDVLLLPGFRWNPFYLALLRARLGKRVFEDTVGDIVRDFYMWDGFPYYAYMPAQAVMLLPVINEESSLEGCTGDDASLLELLKVRVEGHSLENRVRGLAERLPTTARRLEEALRERLKEAWRSTVDALIAAVEESPLCQPGRRSLIRALRLARDEPPMEPLVVVVPLMAVRVKKDGSRQTLFAVVYDEGEARVEEYRDVGEFVGGVSGFIGMDDPGFRHVLCGMYQRCHYVGRSRVPVIDVAVKLMYAGGFYRLVSELGRRRGKPPRLWWARLVEERGTYQCITPRGERCGVREWESCSVCRRGVAAFGMPGHDTPDGVTGDYREAAEALGGDWRVWRPVFRPGEKLCPYCLVKRLAGLPRFFDVVAEALIGYRPPRRVSFPSTDDLAAMATKVAVLDAALILMSVSGGDRAARLLQRWLSLPMESLEGFVEAAGIRDALRRLAGSLSGARYRSGLHMELAEAVTGGDKEKVLDGALRLIDGRWWTPLLLWNHVRMLREALERDREKLKEDVLRAVAGALLFADMEIESAYTVPGVSEALQDLAAALRDAARRMRVDGNTEAASLLASLAEALARPRLYYAALGYDVDRIRDLLIGFSRVVEEDSRPLRPDDYIREFLASHWRVYHSRRRDEKSIEKSIAFLEDYLCVSGRCRDPVLLYHWVSGASVLVSPSYHYALSGSLGYTFLRFNTVASRLGGITVFVGGDQGVALLPSWLPRALMPLKAREGYFLEVARATSIVEAKAETVLLESPAALFAVLGPRILWGAGGVPGFHPVKPGGRGEVLYRVPALVGAGVSLGLRLSHRRDHLYAELEAVRELLRAAKEAGGARLAASMGRVSPAEAGRAAVYASIVPLVPGGAGPEEAVRGTGRYVALAALLAGMVAQGSAGRGLLVGHERLLDAPPDRLPELLGEERLLEGLAQVLAERHVEPGRRRLAEEALKAAGREGADLLFNVLGLASALYDAAQRSGW